MQFALHFSKHNRFTMSFIFCLPGFWTHYSDTEYKKYKNIMKKLPIFMSILHMRSRRILQKSYREDIKQKAGARSPGAMTMVPRRASSCFCFTL